MSMEKINSEELKKMLGRISLSDDELENVTGGAQSCHEGCYLKWESNQRKLDLCIYGCGLAAGYKGQQS